MFRFLKELLSIYSIKLLLRFNFINFKLNLYSFYNIFFSLLNFKKNQLNFRNYLIY
jgi:hypothetical protein